MTDGEGSGRARRAGWGLAAIAGAKAWHILTGYGVAVLLPRILGSPDVFGLYSKVMAALAILNNVLVASATQSVSKVASEDPREAPRAYRKLLLLQVASGAMASGALFVATPFVAKVHGDEALVPLLRVVTLVPLCYSVHAAALGYLNGRRRFGAQAALDAAFYTLRTVGVLGGALLVGGALGPICGFGAAAVLVALLALAFVGVGEGGGAPAYGRWIAFAAPLWLHHAVVYCLIELDVQVLAKAVSELARESGAPARLANELANTQVGYYRAAQAFAFVPYQLSLALAFVVFPSISRATSAGDEDEARSTIRGALRFSLLALLGVAAPLAGAAGGVMRLAYPDEYLAGAPALAVLAPGFVLCSLFVVLGAILTGAGRPTKAAIIGALGLTVAVACTYSFVRRAGIGEHTLAAAALGTSAGMLVAFALAAGAVYSRFRTLFPIASVVRGALAAAAAFGVARFAPQRSAAEAALALAAGALAYVVVLAATRELSGVEASRLRRFLARR
ncbi:MAG TPA: oligosaccharide flippase family protein [Sandaracinaceae bacterium]